MVGSLFIGGVPFFHAFGVVQFACLGWAVLRDRALLVPSLVSVAASLRVALNPIPTVYGFALMLPLYVLIVYLLFAYLPQRGVYDRRAALLWLPLFITICGTALVQQREWTSTVVYPVHSKRGTFYDSAAGRAAAIDAFLAWAETHHGTLAVFPEGVALNYLTGMPTPLPDYVFTPPETADAAVEARIIRELQAHPPDHVVLLSRPVHEYGYRGFGIDYDRLLLAWITAHYAVESAWRSGGFELLLLRSHRQSSSIGLDVRTSDAGAVVRRCSGAGIVRRPLQHAVEQCDWVTSCF